MKWQPTLLAIIKVEQRTGRSIMFHLVVKYWETEEKKRTMLKRVSHPTLLKMDWRSGRAVMFPFLLQHHFLGRQLRMKIVRRAWPMMQVGALIERCIAFKTHICDPCQHLFYSLLSGVKLFNCSPHRKMWEKLNLEKICHQLFWKGKIHH